MDDFETHPTGTAERLATADVLARAVMADQTFHDYVLTWQARTLRAEGKLAEIGRMLDDHRIHGAPMPTFRDLSRVLEA